MNLVRRQAQAQAAAAAAKANADGALPLRYKLFSVSFPYEM